MCVCASEEREREKAGAGREGGGETSPDNTC